MQSKTGWRGHAHFGKVTVMSISIKVAPSNSLIGISDADKGVVPDSIPETGIAATESCILVACLPEVDGDTEITLGLAREVDPGDSPVFDGQLATPSGVVKVFTVEWRPLMEAPVSTASTRVRIWKNRPRFADEVIIGVE
jgi:hypothetical protein